MKILFLILFNILSVFCFGQNQKQFSISGTVSDIENPDYINNFTIYINDTFRCFSRFKNEFKTSQMFAEGNTRITAKRMNFTVFDTTVFIDSTNNHFDFIISCSCYYLGKKQAIIDLEKDSAKLYLSSGIDGIKYKTDIDFRIKYNIVYFDFGCIMPKESCVIEYNQTIFDYLDKKFGDVWRKDIRKDVIGYKE